MLFTQRFHAGVPQHTHRYPVKQTKEGLLHDKSQAVKYFLSNCLQTETWQNTETKALLNLSKRAPVFVDYTPFIKASLQKHGLNLKKETEDAIFNPVFLYIISYPFFLVFVSI